MPSYDHPMWIIPGRGSHSELLGQIFCSRGRPLENSKGRPVDFTGRPVNSTGRPLEFCKFASNDLELPISSRNAIKNFTGHPLEQKIWPIFFSFTSAQVSSRLSTR